MAGHDHAADGGSVVRFAPPEVEGLPAVTEVAIHPDRIDVRTNGRWVTFQFRDIARRHKGPLLDRLNRLLGLEPYPLVVGEREYCTDRRYVSFFCNPTLKVYTPLDPPDSYAGTYIFRINELLRIGGYITYDMS